MSDDRLRELGIPRRRFLRSSAAAAFVAPVVASFSLDGIAEADPGLFPNQCIPNQTDVRDDLVTVIQDLLALIQSGQVGFGPGRSMTQKALDAALAVARGRQRDGCAKLDALVRQIQHTPSVPGIVLTNARNAQARAGCDCFTPPPP